MLNIQKHKDIMVRVLKDIYMDNTLGPLLGFKGGTAAMLCYELNRFSVDWNSNGIARTVRNSKNRSCYTVLATPMR